ncbi:MFS transporter [Halomarina ordinaria]|uniref:MFS transporter n=1 Tax=Halomarina ordinaria TaxID=3033939 RepID=A0ABD5UAC0_9EURY|nr:MFS transporter [Halomarina sp. PSRA2]
MRSRLAKRVYYGWVVAACCFVSSGIMFGMTYSFSVFFDALLGAFDASPARISLVFGVQTFAIYAGAALLGGALDRFGPRRILLLGTLLLGGGLYGTGLSASYPVLVATYGLVTGVGMGCLYLVAYAVVPHWFRRRRGTATGFASAGLGVGMLLIAPGSAELIARYGWRGAFRTLAVVLTALLLLAVLFLADSPGSVGADRSHEFPGESASAERAGRPALDGGVEPIGGVRETVRSLPFALVVLGWTLIYAPLFVLVNHAVPFAGDLGARWAGVLALSVIGFTTSAARLGIGFGADRVGRVRVFVVSSSLMGVSLLALPFAGGPVGLLAVATCFGIGYGGNGALLSPLVADLFGAEQLGALYGIVSLAFGVAGLFASPLASVGYETFGSYLPVFLVVGAVGLAGAACIEGAGRLRGVL